MPFENAVEGRLVWSPDGNYAAQGYSLLDDSYTTVQTRLLIVDVGSWQIVADFEREAGASFADDIVWSPAGERLVVEGGNALVGHLA